MAVAAHAGVGRQPGGVLVEPRRHDARAELVAQVEREVRQAHAVRERARDAHGVRRAARRLGVVLRVGPQLERDRDDVAARAGAQQRRDGGVHPAAHGDERAPRVARQRRVGAGGGAERAVQRVGGQLGGVQLARREPAELGGDLVRADARGVEQARALDERDRGGAGGRHRAAARGLEAGCGDAPALDPQGDRDEVAADSAAGGSDGAAGGPDALPLRKLKMLGEAFGAHAPSLGRRPRSS